VCLGDVVPDATALSQLLEAGDKNALTAVCHDCQDRGDHAVVSVVERGTLIVPVTQAWKGEGSFVDTGQWILWPDTMDLLRSLDGAEPRVLQCVQAAMDHKTRATVAVISPTWLHLGNEPSTRHNIKTLYDLAYAEML